MKKLLMLLAMLLMMSSAHAEEPLPRELMIPGQVRVTLADALAQGCCMLGALPEEHLLQAELVCMTDNTQAWVVTMFDLSRAAGWTCTLSADDGEVFWQEACTDGLFPKTLGRWTSAYGEQADWPGDVAQVYRQLYTLQEDCTHAALTRQEACDIAVAALGLKDASAFQVGYGFSGGAWQLYMIQEGVAVWQVHVDAASGQVTLMTPVGSNG